ncbi:glycoside hydrolase family 13 protein [Alkalibacterium sp. f15]|uniref:glycoside hydrolase family 13 protein n=1 Tax=Alkalibacterium sp. f15 TaxID=3414029 RepID=UPI003BF87D34
MKWWKDAVVYQVYPKSFQDTNGDGIGDLKGIIKRLDYLKLLGINALWLSPVYKSPNDDNGYDISDYKKIHPDYGTMEDMHELIAEARKRGIRLIMDLVVNHTSDEHEWFQEALKGKDNPYRDYYVWRDPVNDGPPNDLVSSFGGSAWEYDEKSGQYYLHIFSRKQPDLNWENATMRKEIYEMINFWLDKGIGGFRMDVIDHIGKVPDEKIVVNGPKLHDYIQEMNEATFRHYDVMTVGETWAATPENAALYSDPDRNELSMIFQFEHIMLDEQPGKTKWDLEDLQLVELKQTFSKWQTQIGENSWNSLFWNNHDTPRVVSRWGNDKEYRVESAKAFAILLHNMQGTPYIFQGEEIGLVNTPITDISQANDIETINLYNERIESGYAKDDVLKSINTKGRDNARRPIPWNDETQGGFTKGEPWQKLNENYETINVEAALDDKASVFYTYQKLIELRKEHEILVKGSFKLLLPDDPQIFAYERELGNEKWTVIANLSDTEQTRSIADKNVQALISNYDEKEYDLTDLKLKPYEAFVFRNE